MTTVDKYVEYALEELNNVKSGYDFIVRDLWVGHVWDNIPIEERRQIGIRFNNEVHKTSPCPVEVLEKTEEGQQKYRKK